MYEAIAKRLRSGSAAQTNPMQSGTKLALGIAAAAIALGLTIKAVRAASK